MIEKLTPYNFPSFDAEAFVSKSKIKRRYLWALTLVLISAACVIWATINWDDHTTIGQNLRGVTTQHGLAPKLYWWGYCIGIGLIIGYSLMWFTIDFKYPEFAVNKDGVFVNKEFIKFTMIPWEEFSSITKDEKGVLKMQLSHPENMVKEQSGFARVFLKPTYITQQFPISVDPKGSPEYEKVIELIEKYTAKDVT